MRSPGHNLGVPHRFVSLDLLEMRIRDRYDFLVNAVEPRPIAFVSTVSASGAPNLAPFSFFMAGGSNPPSLMFSPALNRHGEPKDSLRNVLETREFVVNTVTREMASGMNATSFDFEEGFNEWVVSGFDPLPSEVVKPARVAQSPVQFECRLFHVVEHGSGNGAARYVVGEIVRAHVAENCWTGERIDSSNYRPISRMGGPNYLDTKDLELFVMPRPSEPPQPSGKH